MDIGLDISSSVVGISLLNNQGELLYLDHVKFNKKIADIYEKADFFTNWLKTNNHINDKNIKRIFVEENAKHFNVCSSANTITILAKINALISYCTRNYYSAKVYEVNVLTARKRIGFVNHRNDNRNIKEKIYEYTIKHFPEVKQIMENKYKIKLSKTAYDEIDAFIIAYAGQKIYGN